MSLGSRGLVGATSSSRPSVVPTRARSTPVSSSVSRHAVSRSPPSASSLRPPGRAMCPDQGSRSERARWMRRKSSSSRARITTETAAWSRSPSWMGGSFSSLA